MPSPPLHREIGRWSLAALTVNCVVGAGILGLPGRVWALAGAETGWVVAGTALLALAAALCLAELGGRFDGAGGPAEYVAAAFGPAAGFAVGWLAWAATVLAGASLLGMFAGLVAPGAPSPAIVIASTGLTALAMAGIGRSAAAAATLTVLKLLLLGGIAVAGLFAAPAPATLPAGPPRPAAALVVLFFAFVGFERPGAIAGEVADARRAVPFALVTGMAAVTMLYAGVIAACMRGVPDLAANERPVGALAGRLLGPAAANAANTAAALIVLGTLVSQWITAPRVLLALGQAGQLPPALARLSPKRRTPDAAIVATGLAAALLALSGDVVGALTASSASRLVIFAACAAALIRLRGRARAPASRFRLPAGRAVATCVIAVCAGLMAGAIAELPRLVVLTLIGGLLWLTSKRRSWAAPKA